MHRFSLVLALVLAVTACGPVPRSTITIVPEGAAPAAPPCTAERREYLRERGQSTLSAEESACLASAPAGEEERVLLRDISRKVNTMYAITITSLLVGVAAVIVGAGVGGS